MEGGFDIGLCHCVSLFRPRHLSVCIQDVKQIKWNFIHMDTKTFMLLFKTLDRSRVECANLH